MNLSEHIAELLKKHDCVIIPDLGGFIGGYKSAEIDYEKGVIYPPSKQLLFNPNLTTNDGLLGIQVSQKEGLSYNESLDQIQATIDEWKLTLKSGGRVEIGEIGFLFKQEDQFVFEQNREINLLLAAYGLAPVKIVRKKSEEISSVEREKISKPSIKTEEIIKEVESQSDSIIEQEADEIPIEKPVEVEVEKEAEKLKPIVSIKENESNEEPILKIIEGEKIEEVKEESSEEENLIPLPKKKRRVLRYVAVAALIPIAFYSVWIPAKTDFLQTGTIQLSDFNPMAEAAERSYENRDLELGTEEAVEFKNWDDLTANLSDNVQIYNYQFAEDLYIPIDLEREFSDENILSVDESTDVQETVDVVETSSADTPYHVITGCFSIESNATGLVEELQSKGFPAKILDKKNGLWRVTAGDYSDRSVAKSAQGGLDSQGYSNWILKQ